MLSRVPSLLDVFNRMQVEPATFFAFLTGVLRLVAPVFAPYPLPPLLAVAGPSFPFPRLKISTNGDLFQGRMRKSPNLLPTLAPSNVSKFYRTNWAVYLGRLVGGDPTTRLNGMPFFHRSVFGGGTALIPNWRPLISTF